MKSNAVFHISEEKIRFLKVSVTPKKQVTAVDVISIEGLSDLQISDKLVSFIKEKKINFADTRVTVLVPRSRAILRHMVFPSHKEEEIRSMVDLQVGSEIPYVREEVEIDFQVLSRTQDGYSKLAVVIIPQDIAMRYWKVFSDSKIPVNGITISSIGLWLFYQQQRDLNDKPGAVFDLDVDTSEICLCCRSHWMISREIPIGYEQMQQEGYARILDQWELTLSHLKSEKEQGPVGTVFLVSSANRAYALAVEMGKLQSDLTIKEVFTPQILETARGVQWPKSISDDGVSVASLAGIAFSSQEPPINLIPRSVKQAREQSVFQGQLIKLCIWAIAALISLSFALGMGYFRKNVQVSRLKTELRQKKHEAAQVDALLKKTKDIESMIKGRMIFSDLARELYQLLPLKVYLVNIAISDTGMLSLEGISSNSVDINQFQKDMVKSPSFSNVNLDYVNKRVTQQGEVDYFKISCTINPVKGRK